MKRLALISCFVLGCLLSGSVMAGDVYDEGSIWYLSLVRTEANMQLEYIKDLQMNWKKIMDAAQEEGLILSYKILIGDWANPDDFDMILMVEYENMAALDGLGDKFDVLIEKILGAEEEQLKKSIDREQIRDIFGGKLMQEIHIK